MRSESWVVLDGRHERLPLHRERWRLAKRGDGGVGHGNWTAVAALDLRPDVEGGRAGGVRAGAVLARAKRAGHGPPPPSSARAMRDETRPRRGARQTDRECEAAEGWRGP